MASTKRQMTPLGTRRVVVAWLGIALLALNLLAGAALPVSPPPADGGLQICTSHGLITLGPDGRPVSGPHHQSDGFCVFCLPLMHAGVAPSVIVYEFQPRPVLFLAAVRPPVSKPPARLRLAGAAHPRAPPAA